VSGTSNV